MKAKDGLSNNTNKQIICTPFAFKTESNTGVNVRGNAYTKYLKNACVALCSAKHYNPSCEVALVTNISVDSIPKEYVEVLKHSEISIIEVPYDNFIFEDKYMWSLAFYKLCTLKYLSKLDYQDICYIDTDVYVQRNMDDLWEECRYNIMLYDINHGLQVDDYRIICNEFEKYYGEKRLITHYGGEFFAASTENAKKFVDKLEVVYDAMKNKNIITTKGDEYLISIAADYFRDKIKNAGAYVYRFWTAPGFRLISTCYEYNPVIILHMPNEKNKGMIKLYKKFISKGIIPKKQVVWRICKLNSFNVIDRIKQITKRIIIKYHV